MSVPWFGLEFHIGQSPFIMTIVLVREMEDFHVTMHIASNKARSVEVQELEFEVYSENYIFGHCDY